MRVTIVLDEEMVAAIFPLALAECRPIPMHVEVVLRRALGLPFPIPAAPTKEEVVSKELTERTRDSE